MIIFSFNIDFCLIDLYVLKFFLFAPSLWKSSHFWEKCWNNIGWSVCMCTLKFAILSWYFDLLWEFRNNCFWCWLLNWLINHLWLSYLLADLFDANLLAYQCSTFTSACSFVSCKVWPLPLTFKLSILNGFLRIIVTNTVVIWRSLHDNSGEYSFCFKCCFLSSLWPNLTTKIWFSIQVLDARCQGTLLPRVVWLNFACAFIDISRI